MSNASTVGALRVVLGLDSAAFEGGISKAQKHLRKAGEQMQATGIQIATAGAAATATITTAFAALSFHLLQGSQDAAAAAAQVNAALTSMGGASGKTFDELSKTAEALRNLTGVDDDEILTKVTANLLTFGNVSGAVFDRAQRAVLDLSARLKTDLQGATQMVGKALNDPVKGLAALRRVGIQFTEAQEKQIKAMAAANDMAGAQSIMLRELERQFGGAAEAAAKADIWTPLKTALMDLEGAFEPIVRDVVAPLIQQVANLTRTFADLSPETQKFIAVGAAIAAALGPALIAIGSVVTAVGAITTALGSGGAIAGIAAALAPLAPVILPIVAAIAAVVAAFFLFRDDVEPVLLRLWDTAKKTLGPALGDLFKAVGELVGSVVSTLKTALDSDAGQALIKFSMAVSELMGGVVIQVLTALVKVVATVVRAISDGFKFLGLLLNGDFVGAWKAYRDGTVRALEGLKGALGALATFAVDAIRRMVTGVGTWLTGKLFDVMEGVIKKVRAVSDAFFKLYDAVVGHSYVPDMVTEVGQWMAQLDRLMVAPAQRAADATAKAFEDARQRATDAISRLLTEEERAFLDHQRNLRDLKDGIALGGELGDASRKMLARTQAGWDARNLTLPGLPDLSPLTDDPGIRRLNEAWASIQQQIHDSREAFADSFSYGIEQALNGDWRGLLTTIVRMAFGDGASDGLKSMGRSIFDSFGGSSGSGFNWSSVASTFKNALAWLPGFQHGGTIREGGAGGIDSQLVSFWKSPSERVDIYDPNDAGGGSGFAGNTYHLSGNLLTPEFWAKIQGEVAAGEARIRGDIPGMAVASVRDAQERFAF
nr:phage tail length tape measure family protein [uncultured Brevundimonas sp.]